MVKHLFRAKSKGGMWFTGSLLDDEFILPVNDNTNYWQKKDGDWLIDDYIIKILPETICQYTGFNDRDGIKIFEGDILESPLKRLHKGEYTPIRIVVKDIRDISRSIIFIANEYQVIGNIHDNPELLEVKDGN